MKLLRLFVTLWVCSMPIVGLFAQSAEKWTFRVDPALGGDVLIKSISYESVGDEVYKIFEIESFKDGAYYMDGWLTAPLLKGGYPELNVAVNGIRSDFSFKPQIADWQSLALTDAKKTAAIVKLTKGIHSISVIGKGPLIPYVSKGEQIIIINATNLKKDSLYIVQITIGDKTISKKVTI